MSEELDDWLQRSRQVVSRELPHLDGRMRRGLARGLMLCFGPLVEVTDPAGLADLPEPALFAFNHSNAFEALAVPTALLFHRRGRPLHFLADWMYLQIPLLGWLLRQSDPIPVYTKPARWRLWEEHRRAGRSRSPLAACLERLEAGRSVGIFPEGTRNRSATRLRHGRLGLGWLVLLSDVPVIPVGIEFPAGARRGRVPAIGRLRVRCGEPLVFEAERRAFRRRLAAAGRAGELQNRQNREATRRVVDRVMVAIAELCAKSYPQTRAATS